jgi:transcriptional regulator with XRE-family HTH domain
MMQAVTKLDAHLQGNEQSDGFRRRFAARLDMTMKRAKITSRRLASYLGVNEPEVALWRAGITLPQGGQCRRLSQFLQVDVTWLCLDQGLTLR